MIPSQGRKASPWWLRTCKEIRGHSGLAVKLLRMNICGSCRHAEAQFVISMSPVRPPAGGCVPYLMRAIVPVGKSMNSAKSAPTPRLICRLVVRMADEDEAGASWSSGISEAWRDQLSDPQQDIAATERKCRMLDSWMSLRSFGIGFRRNPIQSVRDSACPGSRPGSAAGRTHEANVDETVLYR